MNNTHGIFHITEALMELLNWKSWMTCSFGMDHPLWDSFTVEVCHLISEDEVLEKDRPPWTHCHCGCLQTHRGTCSCGQHIFLLKSDDCENISAHLVNAKTLELQIYSDKVLSILLKQNRLQSDEMKKTP